MSVVADPLPSGARERVESDRRRVGRAATVATLLVAGPWCVYLLYLAAHATGASDVIGRAALREIHGLWLAVFVVGSLVACGSAVIAGRTRPPPRDRDGLPQAAGRAHRGAWDVVSTVAVYGLVLWFWSPLGAAVLAMAIDRDPVAGGLSALVTAVCAGGVGSAVVVCRRHRRDQ